MSTGVSAAIGAGGARVLAATAAPPAATSAGAAPSQVALLIALIVLLPLWLYAEVCAAQQRSRSSAIHGRDDGKKDSAALPTHAETEAAKTQALTLTGVDREAVRAVLRLLSLDPAFLAASVQALRYCVELAAILCYMVLCDRTTFFGAGRCTCQAAYPPTLLPLPLLLRCADAGAMLGLISPREWTRMGATPVLAGDRRTTSPCLCYCCCETLGLCAGSRRLGFGAVLLVRAPGGAAAPGANEPQQSAQ